MLVTFLLLPTFCLQKQTNLAFWVIPVLVRDVHVFLYAV